MRLSSKSMISILALLATSFVFADEQTSYESKSIEFLPSNIKWGKAPDSLPKGAQLAVLEGDPSKNGLFTIRLKFPANYRIAPHWHSITEHVTVISGNFYFGMGDEFNAKAAKSFPIGSFIYMPPKMHHFGFNHAPTIVQIQDIGPWDIVYVNPKDDPRNQ